MTGAPRIVLFDLGGVLLPFDRARRVRTMSRALDIDADAARRFMDSDLHGRLDRGLADEEELAAALSDLAGRAVPPALARALVLSAFGPPNAPLWALAARLRGRVAVGGFTDNPAFVRDVFPPGAVLDPIFFSSELGMTKTDPEAFLTVAGRLGLPPAAIFFVDDNPANVARAQSLGWEAVVFTSNEQLMADLAERGLA